MRSRRKKLQRIKQDDRIRSAGYARRMVGAEVDDPPKLRMVLALLCVALVGAACAIFVVSLRRL